MSKQTLIAIGAGVLSAILATAFMMRAPGALFIVYLASLPLFMSGLALGPQAVAISGAIGFMATGLAGGGLLAGIFGITLALPAWLVVRQMLLQRFPMGPGGTPNTPQATPQAAPQKSPWATPRDTQAEWFSPGEMLCWLTTLAAGLFLMSVLVNLWGGQSLSELVSTNLAQVLKEIAHGMDPSRQKEAVAIMTPLFPGAVGVSWLVMIIVNAALAQGLLVRLKHNLRPSPTYADLELPNWMSWPLVGSAALALMGSGEMEYTGRNLAMILAVPYFFLGLAVVHAWARRVAHTGMVLVAFYLVLVVSGWAALVVAGIGILEQWTGIRKRFHGPGDQKGGQGPPDVNV